MKDNKALLLVMLSAICGGATPPFAKFGLKSFGPSTSISVRFFIATLVLLPFVVKSRKAILRSLRRYLLIGIVGALNPVLFLLGLQYTDSSVTPLLYAAIPGITTLYMVAIRGERASMQQTAGVVFGFFGVAIVVLTPVFAGHNGSRQGLWGNLIILVAVFTFFIYGLISKSEQTRNDVSALELTFSLSLAAFLFSLPFTTFEVVRGQAGFVHFEIPEILAILETGVVGTSLFYFLYQYALGLSSEFTASLFTYLQPISTILFAMLLLHEQITLPLLCGGFMSIVGAQVAAGRISWRYKRKPLLENPEV